MTPLELIFTALGEELARDASVRHDASGFSQNYDAAIEGGDMAGDARRRVEVRRGISVVSADNFLNLKSVGRFDSWYLRNILSYFNIINFM